MLNTRSDIYAIKNSRGVMSCVSCETFFDKLICQLIPFIKESIFNKLIYGIAAETLQAESLILLSSLPEVKEAFFKELTKLVRDKKIICKQRPENLNKPV